MLVEFFGKAAIAAATLAAIGCTKPGNGGAGCPSADCPAGAAEVRGAQGMRRGAHAMHAPGGPGAGCSLGSEPLPDEVRVAVERALADERRAETEYEELADAARSVPLEHIKRAERRHATALERLLASHGHPLPEPPAPPAPLTVTGAREACALGAASERKNIALYDELLARPLPPDVRCTFERLRAASATRHLPAFERCAGR